jgi:hypothetical protein
VSINVIDPVLLNLAKSLEGYIFRSIIETPKQQIHAGIVVFPLSKVAYISQGRQKAACLQIVVVALFGWNWRSSEQHYYFTTPPVQVMQALSLPFNLE